MPCDNALLESVQITKNDKPSSILYYRNRHWRSKGEISRCSPLMSALQRRCVLQPQGRVTTSPSPSCRTFIRSRSLRIGVMEICNAEVGRMDKEE